MKLLYYSFCLPVQLAAFLVVAQQGEPPATSSKKVYIELGIIASRSRPFNTSGNEGGFARSGINTGTLIGAGIVNRVSPKMHLHTALQVSNISPYIFYSTTVREMSWYSSIDHTQRRWPAIRNVSAATVQISAERPFALGHAALKTGAGLAVNYVFNRNAPVNEEYNILARSTLNSGSVKELRYGQSVNRITTDLSLYLVLEDFKNLPRLRATLQYNLALKARSEGTFVFDKDQGQATGRYRFIGSTAAFKIGWYLTK